MIKWQWNEIEFWAVTATFAHQQFWACLSTQNKFCSQPLHLWLKVEQWMFQTDSWHLAWVFFGLGISLTPLSCQMVLEWHRHFASLMCEMCCDRLEFCFNPFFSCSFHKVDIFVVHRAIDLQPLPFWLEGADLWNWWFIEKKKQKNCVQQNAHKLCAEISWKKKNEKSRIELSREKVKRRCTNIDLNVKTI